MRILVQRVLQALVETDGTLFSQTGRGLLLFVGIEGADGDGDIEWLAGKVSRLRIFDDADGVMNLDVTQIGGEVLAVSQFTLHASTRRGNRPSYIRSAGPEISKPLYERFVARLSAELGREVRTGLFGADMKVSLTNDGPVTIWLDSKDRE